MGMKPDVVALLQYDAKADTFQLWSNIKDTAMEEVVYNLLQDAALAAGEDSFAKAGGFLYTIRFGLRLEDDVFGWEHDCGNHALMIGILLRFLGSLAEVKNLPYGDRPEWQVRVTKETV